MVDAELVGRPPMAQGGLRRQPIVGASDEALIAEAQRGSGGAFDALLERHYAQLVSFATRMTGSDELALDVAQQVFTTVYDQRHRYRAGKSVRAWLYAIARRRCQNLLRQERTQAARACNVPTASYPADDPVIAAEQQATLDALRTALTRLPERERAAVVLFHQLQWSYDEIAAALDCSPGAARTAACRGRARLRAMLAEYEG